MKLISIVTIVMVIFGASFAFSNCCDCGMDCLDPSVIKALQANLQTRGLYKGKLTGEYDTATRKALIRFSKKKKIVFDDYLNKSLVRALWGVEIDYVNASVEERIDFLKSIKVLNDTPTSTEKKVGSAKPEPLK